MFSSGIVNDEPVIEWLYQEFLKATFKIDNLYPILDKERLSNLVHLWN